MQQRLAYCAVGQDAPNHPLRRARFAPSRTMEFESLQILAFYATLFITPLVLCESFIGRLGGSQLYPASKHTVGSVTGFCG